VFVRVSGSAAAPVVLDRRRVELVEDATHRHVYHAVANTGAPAALIDEVADAATGAAAEALRSIGPADALGLVAGTRRLPDDLDRILASHALLHAAEGNLFERAVLDAGNDARLRVHVVDPKSMTVPAAVDALRRTLGAPWQQDHKLATTAALAALSAR
jgi:hypothetical protein